MIKLFVYNTLWEVEYENIGGEIQLTDVYLKGSDSNIIEFLTDDVISELTEETIIQLGAEPSEDYDEHEDY